MSIYFLTDHLIFNNIFKPIIKLKDDLFFKTMSREL